MAVLLWCRRCGEEAVITGDVPTRCLSVPCQADPQPALWTAHLPYRVNENDARFLKSIHICHGKAD